MRRRLAGSDASLIEQHCQLSALTLFRTGSDVLEIVEGFKRVRAARALGLRTLLARVAQLDSVQAKMRMRALQQGCGLTELEEGWLVRSLYRADRESSDRRAYSCEPSRDLFVDSFFGASETSCE